MKRIETMVYQYGIPEATVIKAMVDAANAEQRPQGKQVNTYAEVWDGPVEDAKSSKYAKHLPDWVTTARSMKGNRLKVLQVTLTNIKADETEKTEEQQDEAPQAPEQDTTESEQEQGS